jgi:hypothetical protein
VKIRIADRCQQPVEIRIKDSSAERPSPRLTNKAGDVASDANPSGVSGSFHPARPLPGVKTLAQAAFGALGNANRARKNNGESE